MLPKAKADERRKSRRSSNKKQAREEKSNAEGEAGARSKRALLTAAVGCGGQPLAFNGT